MHSNLNYFIFMCAVHMNNIYIWKQGSLRLILTSECVQCDNKMNYKINTSSGLVVVLNSPSKMSVHSELLTVGMHCLISKLDLQMQ